MGACQLWERAGTSSSYCEQTETTTAPTPALPRAQGRECHPRSVAWPGKQTETTSALDQPLKTRSRGKRRNLKLLPPRAGEGRDGGMPVSGKRKTLSSSLCSRGKRRNLVLLPLAVREKAGTSSSFPRGRGKAGMGVCQNSASNPATQQPSNPTQQQSAISNQQSAISNQQSAISNQQSAISNQQRPDQRRRIA